MCTEIRYNGKIIETQGELAAALGLNTIPNNLWLIGYHQTNDEDCLCGIIIENLAQHLGEPFIRTAMCYVIGEEEIRNAVATREIS